jgi:CHAD domain-containing protein
LDVLHERIRGHLEGSSVPGLKKVLARIVDRRDEAQWPLREIHRLWRQKDYDQRIAQILAGIRWREATPEPPFVQMAKVALRRVVDKFAEAARADLTEVSALHELRISAKRVRYTMEVVAGAFPAPFRKQLYPFVTSVQERLGAINDHATAQRLFEHWATETKKPSAAAELNRLADEEKHQLASKCEAFRQGWTPAQQRLLLDQFGQFLANHDRNLSASNDGLDPSRAASL